ncbi:MAG: Ig-like domain-containing protein [Conexibacter sp.]
MQSVRMIVASALALGLALLLASLAWGAPVLSIVDGPSGPTSSATPQFTFAVDETATSVECSIVPDQATPVYGECSGATTHQPDRPLDDGGYVFWVRASDGVDPPTEISQSFAVDTVAELSLDSGPTDPTADDTPTFGFTAEAGARAVCSIDADISPDCTSPYTPAAPLSDGSHTFRVQVTDVLGNSSSASQGFRVDTTAPSLSIGPGQEGPTNDATPSFVFTAGGDATTVECWVDQDTPARCDSPYTAAQLSDGMHTFHVRVRDALGNTSPVADLDFTIDTVRPSVRVTSGPTITNIGRPSFGFSAEAGARTECSIERGSPEWVRCDDSPYTPLESLSDGRYTFTVRATDAAGNQDVATRTFTVDSQAPTLSLDLTHPPELTNDTTPSFAFVAEAGARAQCSVDQGTPAYEDCTSPYTAPEPLPAGRSTFRVRVVDEVGNLASDSRQITVDTTPPAVSITLGPIGTTGDSTPLFQFVADAETTVACSIDLGVPAFGPCTGAAAHAVVSPLLDGSYTFRVRATDRAGNQTVATRAFTVDTVPDAPGPVSPRPDPTPPVTTPVTPRPVKPQLLSPFPLVRISGTLTSAGARIRLLTVRASPGTLVRVTVSSACRSKRRSSRCRVVQAGGTVGRRAVIGFRALEHAYRSGTVIVVRVWRADRIGKYTRFTIVRGKAPRRVDQCLVPEATSGSRCPTG